MKYSVLIKTFALSCFLLWGSACEHPDTADQRQTPEITGENPALPNKAVIETADPVEAVRKAYEKMATVRSYRSRHEMTGPTGAALITDMEIVAPDRIRSVQTGTGTETIVIGGDFYIKTSGSVWEKSELLSHKPGDLAQGQQMFQEALKNLSQNVQSAGPDTIDGIPVNIYRYSVSQPNQDGDETNISLWIGARDSLIYKYEYESEIGFGEKPVKMKSVIKMYDFGADIKIDPPA